MKNKSKENWKKIFNATFEEMASELSTYEKSIISKFELKYFKKMEETNGK